MEGKVESFGLGDCESLGVALIWNLDGLFCVEGDPGADLGEDGLSFGIEES